MNPVSDLPVLWRLLRGQPAAGSHQDRLDAFYRPQASRYDAFRERLLHGRGELIERIPVPDHGVLVELGGGTGRNLEFFGPRLHHLWSTWLVDLCPALLEQADARSTRNGWTGVRTVHADACTWNPAVSVDVVLCSYSLTMIPDWFAAIENAYRMLRPGGLIAVVDFTVSRKHPPTGLRRHGTFTRHFWPLWFGHDGVHPNPDHLPYLMSRFTPELTEEHRGRVPWMLGLSAPYYQFIGRKV